MPSNPRPRVPTYFIACCSHKGGPGKTTIAVNLTHAIRDRLRELTGRQDVRICAVDLEPQGDMSSWLSKENVDEHWLYNLTPLPRLSIPYTLPRPEKMTLAYLMAAKLMGTYNQELLIEALEPVSGLDGIYLLPNDHQAERVQKRLVAEKGPEAASEMIVDVLTDLDGIFDVVLFDCPPNLSEFVDAALQIAHRVVIPMLPDKKSLQAVLETRQSLYDALRVNPKIEIGAIVVNADQERTNMSKAIKAVVQKIFGTQVFPIHLRQQVVMRELDMPQEANGRGETIFEADPNNPLVAAFTHLATHLLVQHPAIAMSLSAMKEIRPSVKVDMETHVTSKSSSHVGDMVTHVSPEKLHMGGGVPRATAKSTKSVVSTS